MAHPVAEARHEEQRHAEKHAHRSGYKRGGAIASDDARDKVMIRRAVHQHESHDHKGEKETDLKLRKGGKVEGHKTKARHDRRARGGHIKHRADGGDVPLTRDQVSLVNRIRAANPNSSIKMPSGVSLPNETQGQGGESLPNSKGPPDTYENQKRGGAVRRRKYADGGHVKHHGGKSPGKINIVIATGGGASERQQAMQQGMQVGARLAAGAARPPMAAPAGPPPVPPRPPMAGPPGMAPGIGAPPMAGPPGLPPGGVPVRPPMKRGGGVKRQMGGYAPMNARPMPVATAAPGMANRVMNRGGFALKDAGAGGAKGRMEKEKAYGHGGATHVQVRGHMRRKAGGRIERDCD